MLPMNVGNERSRRRASFGGASPGTKRASSGFWKIIVKLPCKLRVGIDPLPLSELCCGESLRSVIRDLREPVQFQVSQDERTPFPDASFDLVLCCNVLDHVQDPGIVLSEVCRVLRPAGFFYLFVDVFSVVGIVKWKFWTQRKSKDEILVPRILIDFAKTISTPCFNAQDCVLSGKMGGPFGIDYLRTAPA